MSATLKSRQRIARVRSIQHRLALMAERRGRDTVDTLARRSDLITRLHATMTVAPGPSTGDALARASELAGRFALAGIGVDQEKASARSRLAALTGQRIASERDRDGAVRLADAARAAHDDAIEKRASRRLVTKGSVTKGSVTKGSVTKGSAR